MVTVQDFQKEFNCHFNFDGGIDTPGILAVNSDGLQVVQCGQVQVHELPRLNHRMFS